MQFSQNPVSGVSIQGKALPSFDYTKPLCIIGHKTSAGTVNANTVYTVNSAYDVTSMFGGGSMLANAAYKFKKKNSILELKALALSDNGSGVKTTLARTFSGTATSNGTLYYEVLGSSYSLTVTTGDTAASIATALAALINSDASAMVTAAVSTATITLSYKHKGNFQVKDLIKSINSQNSALPVSGITWSAATLTVGSGLQDISDAIDAIKNLDCNFVIPVEYLLDTANQVLLLAEIRRRLQISDANDYKLLNGFFTFATNGSYSSLTTDFATFNLNDLQRVLLLGQKTSSNTDGSTATTEDDLVIATMFASGESKVISDGVDTSAITPDQVTGSKNRITRARGGMIIEGLTANGKPDWVNFEFTESRNLKKLGITPLRQEANSIVTDEAYTMANPNNANAIFRQYPIALCASVVQTDLYRKTKRFANLNVTDKVINDVSAMVDNALILYTSDDYEWLKASKLNAMISSKSIKPVLRTIDDITKEVLTLSVNLYPVSPLEDMFTTISFDLV